ncbi:lachesin-like [Apostichopus japonicus]|uniref:lachesin-like n=1 Tax=Stichopus japonicus TaxID=307972 RepID=UPI003AB16EC9
MDNCRIGILISFVVTMTILRYVDSSNNKGSGNAFVIVVCNKQLNRVPERCKYYADTAKCRKLKQCMRQREKSVNGTAFDMIYTQPGDRVVNKSREGDTVNFECKIFNVYDMEYHISWYRNDDILFSENRLIPPMSRNDSKRYHVQEVENNTHILTISEIARHMDDGLYACRFNVEGTKGIEETFILNIVYSPEIEGITIDGLTQNPSIHQPDPSVSTFVYNETQNAFLRCVATGSPKPNINWTRDSVLLQGDRIEQRDDLVLIKNLSRTDNGRYRCHAYNDQGKSSSDYINIRVQYPPEIHIPKAHETGDRSRSVRLECLVHAEPPATKQWIRNDEVIIAERTQNRIYIANDENSTRIHILNITPSTDYSNYTCKAENLLGTAEASIELNGLPTAPEIFSTNISHHRNSYNLRWSYKHTDDDSRVYFTYCYLRKQIYMNGKLKSVIDNPNAPCFNVTIPKHAKERIFTSRLTDLFPNANYLLELYAVNQYGKGDIAEHTFKTAEVDISSTPSTCTFDSPDSDTLIGGTPMAVSPSHVVTFMSLLVVCASVIDLHG